MRTGDFYRKQLHAESHCEHVAGVPVMNVVQTSSAVTGLVSAPEIQANAERAILGGIAGTSSTTAKRTASVDPVADEHAAYLVKMLAFVEDASVGIHTGARIGIQTALSMA